MISLADPQPSLGSTVMTVLVPAKDEVAALPALAEGLAQLARDLKPHIGIHWILIDDGSTDGTASTAMAYAQEHGLSAVALSHPHNQGIGTAMRTAAPHLQGELVFVLDADLPYPLELVPRLVQAVLAGDAVATASPWMDGGSAPGTPPHRALISRLASRLHGLRFRRWTEGLQTLTCAFRVWRRETFEAALPARDGFVSTAEMLLRARALGARVSEHPAPLCGRRVGRSKMKLWPTLWAHLGLLLRGPSALRTPHIIERERLSGPAEGHTKPQ